MSQEWILYDDQCGLCRRFKEALERLPGTKIISMVSVHDDSLYLIYPELKKNECLKDIHFIDQEKKIYKGKDALAQIIKRFPLSEKFTWLVESGMGQKTLDFFNKVAKSFREDLIKDCKNCNS